MGDVRVPIRWVDQHDTPQYRVIPRARDNSIAENDSTPFNSMFYTAFIEQNFA